MTNQPEHAFTPAWPFRYIAQETKTKYVDLPEGKSTVRVARQANVRREYVILGANADEVARMIEQGVIPYPIAVLGPEGQQTPMPGVADAHLPDVPGESPAEQPGEALPVLPQEKHLPAEPVRRGQCKDCGTMNRDLISPRAERCVPCKRAAKTRQVNAARKARQAKEAAATVSEQPD